MLKNKNLIFIFFIFLILGLIICASSSYTLDEFKYDSKGRRNPFIQLVTSDGRIIKLEVTEGDQSDVAIEGIIHDKTGISYAIINGTIVKVGDYVGPYQILKIEEKKVILVKDGEISEAVIKREDE